eukprot:1145463-Pelagomonas_calceolata.AAC.2
MSQAQPHLPTREAIENIAVKLVHFIKECHEVALQVCTSKEKTANSKHYKIRRIGNLRKSLCNKHKPIRHVQYDLPQAHLIFTFEEALAQNHHHPNLHKASLSKASPTQSTISLPLPQTVAPLPCHRKRLSSKPSRIIPRTKLRTWIKRKKKKEAYAGHRLHASRKGSLTSKLARASPEVPQNYTSYS